MLLTTSTALALAAYLSSIFVAPVAGQTPTSPPLITAAAATGSCSMQSSGSGAPWPICVCGSTSQPIFIPSYTVTYAFCGNANISQTVGTLSLTGGQYGLIYAAASSNYAAIAGVTGTAAVPSPSFSTGPSPPGTPAVTPLPATSTPATASPGIFVSGNSTLPYNNMGTLVTQYGSSTSSAYGTPNINFGAEQHFMVALTGALGFFAYWA